MNGVSALSGHRGLPATAVVRLSSDKPVPPANRRMAGNETILAAVTHPPRGGEPRPLSALVPAVLAQYGLGIKPAASEGIDCVV